MTLASGHVWKEGEVSNSLNLRETMGGCGHHIDGLHVYCGHNAIRHNNVNKQ